LAFRYDGTSLILKEENQCILTVDGLRIFEGIKSSFEDECNMGIRTREMELAWKLEIKNLEYNQPLQFKE